MSTGIGIVRMEEIALQGVAQIGYEQQIANIVKGEDAKHDVVDGTDGCQSGQVEHGI